MAQLSQCQTDALDKVKELLDEHFEAWVLVWEAEVDDRTEHSNVGWFGGHSRALGLLVLGQDVLRNHKNKNLE